MIEFKQLTDLAGKLGIIRAVKDKLINNPDPAAEKFIIALEEISKLYSATESEIARYLSVNISSNGINQEDRQLLNSLEVGPLSLRWSEARGHCHKLLNIHDKYLNKWFSKVLEPAENDQMKDLFNTFAMVEGGFLDNLDMVTKWLSKQAEDSLNFVDDKKYIDANKMLRAARKEILPFRKIMNEAMKQMLDLQTEFIVITDTT